MPNKNAIAADRSAGTILVLDPSNPAALANLARECGSAFFGLNGAATDIARPRRTSTSVRPPTSRAVVRLLRHE